jgi:site-specific DNA recombinase
MKKLRLIDGEQPAKPVGIWIRVSTEDQARGESPEHHEKRARAYVEAKGWKIREVYHLEAVSGKSVMGHPETKRMLGHLASGHITGLIFSKLARLARNTRELLDFADIFRDQDADLISLHESIDTTTPAGRLFYTMIAAMAQWEREEIAERVAASVPIRAKLGKSTGGAAPFGYQWKDKQLIPDPREAPVRRLIYELFLEQKRKKAVARLLNEKGYRTRSGGKFTDTTIDRLLRDPIAKGVRRANYTRSGGIGRGWKLKPRDEWVVSSVEPTVSEELWRQCNAILEAQRERLKRPQKKAVHLFAGVVRCHCGEKMYVLSESGKYICRKCRNKISGPDLEEVFREQLRSFLVSPEDVARAIGQADEEIRGKEERLKGLEAEQTKVLAAMEKVHRAYVSDEISMEAYGRQYRPLEERLKGIEEELPRLQGEVDFLKVRFLARDEVLAESRDLFERWPALSLEEKRGIVEAIVEGIQIGKEEVEIDLSYFCSSAEVAGKGQQNLTGSLPPRSARAPDSTRCGRRAPATRRRSRAAPAARRAAGAASAPARPGTAPHGAPDSAPRDAADCRRRSFPRSRSSDEAAGADGAS